jgi:hypothetical protein
VSQINFYIFLCICEKFSDFVNEKEKNAKKLNIFINFGKIAISRPQIEGLCVKFPPIFRFSGANLPILGQKIRNFLQKTDQ